ncbi:NF038122 family metalloprotease [Bradyrhizobium sp. LLZ17]|uniref:NF038122 family metalloprotease n=1 Tax=Bradyrhizobium sp. LLZ17 TaxID=3239388 RepID=A0AB39XMD8_9BRAD
MTRASTQDELLSDDPFYTVVGGDIQGSYFPDTAGATPSSTTTTGSVMSVTSGGITINLILDAAAQAAPASFKNGLQQAVAILAANISDKITVNINIDYSGIGGGAAAGPDNGLYETYAWTRSELATNASAGDTTFNSLPTGSTIQGQSNVAVWNAQLKLWGVIGANDTTTDDASANFSTDINPNLLVGVALHELTHAMGRVPYGSAPDVFDLFRFTSQNVHLFQGAATAPAAYFSLDNGATKIADYGQTSDPSDFLNSGVQGPNDPFNEYYTSSTIQGLTSVDLKQLDVLGFHLAVNSPVTIESYGSTSLVQAGTNYFMNPTTGGAGPSLKYGGVSIVPGQFSPMVPIAAEQVGSGYDLAWKASGVDQYMVWSVDSNGNLVANLTGTISGSSYSLTSLEATFHQDLNGDGVISAPDREVTVYDTQNNQSWSYEILGYDAQNRLNHLTAKNDDGTTTLTDYNPSHLENFQWAVSQYNAAAQSTSVSIYPNDPNHSLLVTSYDPQHLQSWKDAISGYNASGQLAYVTVEKYDGTSAYTVYDHTGSGIDYTVYDYAANGHLTSTHIYHHDGTIVSA